MLGEIREWNVWRESNPLFLHWKAHNFNIVEQVSSISKNIFSTVYNILNLIHPFLIGVKIFH